MSIQPGEHVLQYPGRGRGRFSSGQHGINVIPKGVVDGAQVCLGDVYYLWTPKAAAVAGRKEAVAECSEVRKWDGVR